MKAKPAAVFRSAREIRDRWRAEELEPQRLAILASFVAEPLDPYLIVAADDVDCALEPWFVPFGTFEQRVLDPQSDLWHPTPAVVWIALRLEDVSPELPYRLVRDGPAAVATDLDELRERLTRMARAARRNGQTPILVSNLWASHDLGGALFDAADPDGLTHLLAAANRDLARDLEAIDDCHLFDEAWCVAEVGHLNWSDRRLRHATRVAPGVQAQTDYAHWIVRAAVALLRPPVKCIVLDLDNTLWGGVLGDDGTHDLALGDDYPGSVFKEFQRTLLDLRSRGFLLAIASKNDSDRVSEVLDDHPEMVLRREHFAVVKANWDPKPGNLIAIAEELSIGLETLLFVDDNPVERAQVARELPQVAILDLPADPVGFLPALLSSPYLDRSRLSPEDRSRGESYAADGLRRRLREAAPSVGEFLCSLEMKATVGRCDEASRHRVVQLLHKTNQFNLTTRRHAGAQVRRFMEASDAEVLWLRLRDRYADLGLVCVGIIVEVNPGRWEIDTFLMSCRVMERGVEDAFLAFLVERARGNGARSVRGVYCATGSNHMTARFYGDRGFTAVGEGEDGALIFEYDLAQGLLPWPAAVSRGGVEP